MKSDWLRGTSAAFRLMIATSWLAPDAWWTNQEEAIREAVAAGTDWNEYLRLVERHGTPGLSWAALKRVPGITIPEAAAQELQKRSDLCRKQAIVDCLLLGDVVKRFHRAAIPVMPLKGQFLSFKLYQDVGLRYSRDLDVEVAKEDLEKAQACLESKDWRLEPSFFRMSPRQWESFLRHESHINFVHAATGRMLELHWRVQWETPEATTARWARSVPDVWQGNSILAMHPDDLALYLCSHGGLHAWFRAKWLGDVARTHSLGLVDWETALQDARRSAQERVLLAGLLLLKQVHGLPLPNLSRNAWISWSPQLIETPLRALENPDEPLDRVSPAKLRNRIRMGRYEQFLWPRKAWRSSFAELIYGREDFRTLPLPDGLFWMYKPLRPLLWLWRWVRQTAAGPARRN